ncbi:unnamed protein product [Adineta ricciae]|uniref:Uncharacterized protein n=1 Tax=Adineta ricciae TaxID=249248 RepID=A0A813SMN6_ADIRI|nr:unnamed protein product [Adineta ricciae]
MYDSCVTDNRYPANLIWKTFLSWRLPFLLVFLLLIVLFTCCWRYSIQYWRQRTRDDDVGPILRVDKIKKISSRISKPKQIKSIKNKRSRATSMLSLTNLNKLSSSKIKVSLVVAKENNDTKKNKSTHQPLSNISSLTINGIEKLQPKSVSH